MKYETKKLLSLILATLICLAGLIIFITIMKKDMNKNHSIGDCYDAYHNKIIDAKCEKDGEPKSSYLFIVMALGVMFILFFGQTIFYYGGEY